MKAELNWGDIWELENDISGLIATETTLCDDEAYKLNTQIALTIRRWAIIRIAGDGVFKEADNDE